MVTVKTLGGWVADATNGRRSHNSKKWVVGADINHRGDHVFPPKNGKRRNSEEQPQDGVSIWDSLGKTSDSEYHTKKSDLKRIYLSTR